ncbi:MAG: rRNA maturation RNase YbeY [Pirellulales bacterium]|nr:rRNA maturation RNase YbeY [Pirellulales bacterium]
MIQVDVNNDQVRIRLDEDRLREAVRVILRDASVSRGEISLAIVDDATICELHGKYLGEAEPTDVLSFALERGEHSLDGEVIVSAETAEVTSRWYGWAAEDELLLYVIHGTLHLVGYDDATPPQKAEMRERESAYLAHFGLRVPQEDASQIDPDLA